MSATAPTGSSERIGELDVVRGFALLGVFIIHFTSSSFYNLNLTEAQQQAFLANPLDRWIYNFAELVFLDKANTLFAVLFGMGFWIMLDRLRERGANFEKIYFRRVLILLVIGSINLYLLFPGDVLQKYALLGLVLLLVHRLPPTAMLCIGLILAVFGMLIGDLILSNSDAIWEAFQQEQNQALAQRSYLNWVTVMFTANVRVDFVEGGALGWGLYLFGRFLIGAWIIRQGWLQRASELLPAMRRLALLALPIGVALEAMGWAMYWNWIPGPSWLDQLLHTSGLPFLVIGYALMLILLFHSRWKSAAEFFIPVGRMALTAYIAHGVVFTVVYMPFGLDLLPVLGPARSFGLAIGLFVAMTFACRAWLGRFKMGPLEHLWRWATYGERPKMKLGIT